MYRVTFRQGPAIIGNELLLEVIRLKIYTPMENDVRIVDLQSRRIFGHLKCSELI